jgi:8-oxo-dGTP pyrophosphatase MutT (NUDIX family)
LLHGLAGYPAMGEIDRPGPGEELNTSAAVTPPRLAATVILLRGGAEKLELLLVKRTPKARFMGGVWVFPGGAVDQHEGDGDVAVRAAAVRELEEEAGVVLDDPAALVPFSRWITPAEVKIRFDTWFFLAPAPSHDVEIKIDEQEAVDWGWYTPDAALEAHKNGEILLVFPTIKHLEQLAPFDNVEALVEHARGQEIRPVLPKVITDGETARVLLPGEPGYDEAPEV